MIAFSALLAASLVVLAGARFAPRDSRVDDMRAGRRRRPSTTARAKDAGGRRRDNTRIVLAVVGMLLATFIGGLLLGIAIVSAVAAHRTWSRHRRARNRETIVRRQFPEFVDLLVLTITSGLTPRRAFESLAGTMLEPIDAAVRGVVDSVRRGHRFADAIRQLPVALGPVAQPLSDALSLADRYGTSLPPVLDRLAFDARADRRRNAEIAARQLPIRLSFPLVGCTLPSFVLLTIVPLMAGTLSSLQRLMP